MYKITRALIVPLIGLYLSTPLAAASTTQAWTLSKDQVDVGKQIALMDQLSSPTNWLAQVNNKYFVELKASELRNLKRGDALDVPLPNGFQSFVVTKRQINASGTQSLTARAQNLADGGFVIITLGKNMFHLTAQAAGMTYTGRGYDSVGILVSESDYQRTLPSLEMHEIRVDDTDSNFGALRASTREEQYKSGLYTEGNEQQATETVIIDVLFYYTEGVRNTYNNQHQSRIDHIIAITNFIFSESKINVQIHGTSIEIDYSGTDTLRGLVDMKQQINGFETLNDDRYLNGADAVALLLAIDSNARYCGSAFQINPLTQDASEFYLSAVGTECRDIEFAHELGHNLGLMHSRVRGESGNAFDFGVGYGIDNEFYTTMAIARDYNSKNLVDQPEYKFIYSSPDLDCGNGSPCGIPEGDADSADAAQAIRLVASTFALAYERNPDTTLATDAIAQVADPALKSCLSNSQSLNENKYAAGWDSLVCYDFLVTDLSGIESFKRLKRLILRVTDEIDLSSLAGMDDLEVLHLTADSYDESGEIKLLNLDVLSSKPKLSNLVLQNLGIKDIDFLRNTHMLTQLNLDGNPISDFTPIFSLPKIEDISLARTNFPGSLISNFRDLNSLHRLNLSSNEISKLANVVFPNSLMYLDLSINQLVSLPNIDSGKSLYQLNLLANPLADIDSLADSVNLGRLNLGFTQIDDISSISKLNQLVFLNLESTKINSIEVISEFTELNQLKISNTLVSDIGPALIHLTDSVDPNYQRDNFGFDRLTIPCWQRAYGESLQRYIKYISFNSTTCFTDEDYSDYDGDGIANIVEVNFGLNPLVNDSNGDGVDDTLASSMSLDADGDGKADLFVRNTDTFYNYGKASLESNTLRLVFGLNAADIPTYGDFDGDGVTDITMYRPSTSMWYVKNTSSPGARGDYIQRIRFGLANEDTPVAADYDGDGMTDIAVYRPSTYMWYIQPSSGGDIMELSVGANDGDIPVTGDFDGDGKADIAIRRPSTHTWHILRSSDGQEQVITFGLAEEDIPVPADYDGDGITDLAVRRPSTQMWYILNSSGEPGPYGDGIQRIKFGLDPADIPIVDDYDGDGKADIAVRRASTQMQYILTSSGEGGDRGDGIMRVRFGLQEKYVPFQAPIHIRMQMVEANNQ